MHYRELYGHYQKTGLNCLWIPLSLCFYFLLDETTAYFLVKITILAATLFSFNFDQVYSFEFQCKKTKYCTKCKYQIVFLEHFNQSDSELVSGLSRAQRYTQVEFFNYRSTVFTISTLVNRPDEKLVNPLCAIDKVLVCTPAS